MANKVKDYIIKERLSSTLPIYFGIRVEDFLLIGEYDG